MKVVTENLHNGLSFLRNVVSASPFVPVLRNVHISTDSVNNTMTLFGKDTELGSITIPAVSDENVSFIAPLHTLLSLISEVKKSHDVVELRLGKYLTLIYGDNKSRINLEDVDTYPEIIVPQGKSFSIGIDELADLFSMGEYAVGDTYVLTTLHLQGEDDTLIAEATNTVSGGYKSKDVVCHNFDIAIPSSLTRIVSKLRTKEVITLWIHGDKFFVSGNGWYLGTSLYNGVYVNLSGVYTNSNSTQLIVDKSSLKSALGILRVFLDEDVVYLEITQTELVLSVQSDIGEAEETVAVSGSLVPMSLAVSYTYLEKVISSVSGDAITFQIGSPREPILVPDTDSLYFIIPKSSRKKGR